MKGPRIFVVLGTRPEIIKVSALLRILQKTGRDFRLIHTGQHFSFSMDRLFFEQLALPKPHHHLDMKSRAGETRMKYVLRMAAAIESIFEKEGPGAVLVQGDTNSVLAGALAARRVRGMVLGHIEAGLRSYDRSMPEELNRIRTDAISDKLFPPTARSKAILLKEGTDRRKIVVTGNTIVDAVRGALPLAKKKVRLSRWVRPGERYFLVTLHRAENVDSRPRLVSIVRGLEKVAGRFGRPMLFPVHPRTAARLKDFGIELPERVRTIEPVGFLEFLRLEASAELILTDSGGVQEEACILRVPCVTLRTSTERPETVTVRSNVVAGYEPEAILRAAEKMIRARRVWKNPFGDGRASERILRTMESAS